MQSLPTSKWPSRQAICKGVRPISSDESMTWGFFPKGKIIKLVWLGEEGRERRKRMAVPTKIFQDSFAVASLAELMDLGGGGGIGTRHNLAEIAAPCYRTSDLGHFLLRSLACAGRAIHPFRYLPVLHSRETLGRLRVN